MNDSRQNPEGALRGSCDQLNAARPLESRRMALPRPDASQAWRPCSTRPSASPAPRFRFGLDGIIGLVPGLGDVLAGLLSADHSVAAWIRGVPYITLVRMAANLGIGVLVGTIPIFGDIFDVAWKPNRRNYRLLQRHLGEPRRHTWRDWAFLAAAGRRTWRSSSPFPSCLCFWLLAWLLIPLSAGPPRPGIGTAI